MTDTDETARLRGALERIHATAEAYGDIAGAFALSEIARRALAGEDIAPTPGPLDLKALDKTSTTRTSCSSASLSAATASGPTRWTCRSQNSTSPMKTSPTRTPYKISSAGSTATATTRQPRPMPDQAAVA